MSRPGPLTVTAIGIGPSVVARTPDRPDLCAALSAWAIAADVSSPRCGTGGLAIWKSCLLSRIIYGGELGPSQTPCPVHLGKWSGVHFGWPGSVWRGVEGDTPAPVEPRLQEWWDAGCRCATHRGANDTTGWNPDADCGCLPEVTP